MARWLASASPWRPLRSCRARDARLSARVSSCRGVSTPGGSAHVASVRLAARPLRVTSASHASGSRRHVSTCSSSMCSTPDMGAATRRGECLPQPRPEGTPCSDGKANTYRDICIEGSGMGAIRSPRSSSAWLARGRSPRGSGGLCSVPTLRTPRVRVSGSPNVVADSRIGPDASSTVKADDEQHVPGARTDFTFFVGARGTADAHAEACGWRDSREHGPRMQSSSRAHGAQASLDRYLGVSLWGRQGCRRLLRGLLAGAHSPSV